MLNIVQSCGVGVRGQGCRILDVGQGGKGLRNSLLEDFRFRLGSQDLRLWGSRGTMFTFNEYYIDKIFYDVNVNLKS